MSRFLMLISSILLVGCSKNISFDSDVSIADLAPETVETELIVLNFEVDQIEFSEMYENEDPFAELEVDGDLFAYRNQDLIIDGEEVEMELKGRTTNESSLKSLGVEFEDPFDNSNRDFLKPRSELSHHSLDEITAFRLRNSGNDQALTMIKDASYTQLAVEAGLDVDIMYYEPALVFINGNFLGLMNLRNDSDGDGITSLFAKEDDQISLVEIYQKGNVLPKSDYYNLNDAYFEAIEDEDIEFVRAHTDEDNLIDYFIFETFVANFDWPHNNARLYAFDEEKYRFLLFDLDLCNTMWLKKDPLFFSEGLHDNPITDLFNLLMAEEDFSSKFESRYEELLSSGKLDPSNFEALVNENSMRIENEIDFQIQRHGQPYSKIEWYRQLDLLVAGYEKRWEYFE